MSTDEEIRYLFDSVLTEEDKTWLRVEFAMLSDEKKLPTREEFDSMTQDKKDKLMQHTAADFMIMYTRPESLFMRPCRLIELALKNEPRPLVVRSNSHVCTNDEMMFFFRYLLVELYVYLL